MMTFGDCMSLLVTFFVMLIAFSNLEERKLTEMLGAMRGALGAVDRFDDMYLASTVESDLLHTSPGEEEHRFLTLEEISGLLPRFVDEVRAGFADLESPYPDRMIIRMLDEGMAVLLHSSELFAEGSTQWIRDYGVLWDGFDWLLRGRANDIRITAMMSSDTLVYSETAHTAWGLGIERAEAVAGALQQAMNASASRFGTGVQVLPGPSSAAHIDRMEIMIMSLEATRQTESADLDQSGVWP